MSIELYTGIAMVVACWFSTDSDLDQGDYQRGLAILLFAALWPVTVGLGFGLTIRNATRFAKRLIARVRSA